MIEDLATAFALVLVLEGFLPGLAPRVWQRNMEELAKLNPKTVRIFGILSMVAGALLFQYIK